MLIQGRELITILFYSMFSELEDSAMLNLNIVTELRKFGLFGLQIPKQYGEAVINYHILILQYSNIENDFTECN